MRSEELVIEVEGLTMSYGSTAVLRGVDFVARRGEVIALLGPNGAGKSTTIEILEGFRAPSGGVVRVLGKHPLTAGEAWRSRIGVVLQSWRDHGKWRVGELLGFFARFYEPYETEGRRPFAVADLLDQVGLSEHATKKVSSLSGGQRRRLDVAIGIVGRPALLFLDEPTAGFDPVARRDFHELVHRLSDLDDTTILLTTHDLAEAERLADRILILDGGVIVADGSPDELSRQIAGTTEVRWLQDGQRQVHSAEDPTAFVRELLERGGEISDLEVVRSTLEDVYLAMVRRRESATTAEGAVR